MTVFLCSGQGTIEIDDVQVADIEGRKLTANFDGVGGILGFLVKIPFQQPHALAVSKIDCRDDLHYSHSKKLLSNRAPALDDRSG